MAAVTRELARYAVESRFEDLPEAVRHEGERAFVNILGCMLGGVAEAWRIREVTTVGGFIRRWFDGP
jgi:hypothetical protein